MATILSLQGTWQQNKSIPLEENHPTLKALHSWEQGRKPFVASRSTLRKRLALERTLAIIVMLYLSLLTSINIKKTTYTCGFHCHSDQGMV